MHLSRTTLYIWCLFLCFLIISCKSWVMPDFLAGNWAASNPVSVRTKPDGNWKFTPSPGPIEVNILISDSGNITGSIGNATLKNTVVKKNRGWLGRHLHLATDYELVGELEGPIWENDPLKTKNIIAPFNYENGQFNGTLFQKEKMGLYPMMDFNLKKK